MGVVSAIVLYVVIWFLTFFVVLPLRVKTQGDLGEVMPGTHAGAPEVHNLRRKAWITTGVAFVIWAIIAGTIFSGLLPVSELNLLKVMPPLE